jgi:hypothetical protein
MIANSENFPFKLYALCFTPSPGIPAFITKA